MTSRTGDLWKGYAGKNRRTKPEQVRDAAIGFVRRPEKVV
jgi:hypothetical protein